MTNRPEFWCALSLPPAIITLSLSFSYSFLAGVAITAKRRMATPEDNNERQPVHAHESVPLP
jgi:hypothetical protein